MARDRGRQLDADLALGVAGDRHTSAEQLAERPTAAARALARRGLEHNPLSPELWNVLGDCELHARRPREALDCSQHAIELNPCEVRGRYNAAYALTARRDHAGALRMIAATAFDRGDHDAGRPGQLSRRTRSKPIQSTFTAVLTICSRVGPGFAVLLAGLAGRAS